MARPSKKKAAKKKAVRKTAADYAKKPRWMGQHTWDMAQEKKQRATAKKIQQTASRRKAEAGMFKSELPGSVPPGKKASTKTAKSRVAPTPKGGKYKSPGSSTKGMPKPKPKPKPARRPARIGHKEQEQIRHAIRGGVEAVGRGVKKVRGAVGKPAKKPVADPFLLPSRKLSAKKPVTRKPAGATKRTPARPIQTAIGQERSMEKRLLGLVREGKSGTAEFRGVLKKLSNLRRRRR